MENTQETLVKVVLVKVYASDTKKDGTQYLDKNNKPYQRVAIQTNAHGDNWLSCFSFRSNDLMRTWREGQEVEILVSKNGDYWNFREPRKTDLIEQRLTHLEQRLSRLENNQGSTGTIEDINAEL